MRDTQPLGRRLQGREHDRDLVDHHRPTRLRPVEQQILPVQPGLCSNLRAVQGEPTRGGLAQPPAQGGVLTQRALGLHVRSLAGRGVPLGFVRVVADDPPDPGCRVEPDFLDPEVVADPHEFKVNSESPRETNPLGAVLAGRLGGLG
jgi:hypothetical protein